MIDFSKEMHKILDNYSEEVAKAINEDVDAVAKETVKQLKATSPQGKTGKYAKGWTSTKENGRTYNVVTVHNTKYQVAHLLEHGHALVKGGRTIGSVKAYPHIKEAEEQAIQELERKVEASINGT